MFEKSVLQAYSSCTWGSRPEASTPGEWPRKAGTDVQILKHAHSLGGDEDSLVLVASKVPSLRQHPVQSLNHRGLYKGNTGAQNGNVT